MKATEATRSSATAAARAGQGARLRRWANAAAWALLWLAIVAAVPAAVAWYVVGKHRWAQRNLDELAPQYARLAGLVEHASALEERAQQAQAAVHLRLHGAEADAQALANETLQRVRGALEQAGVAIESSQTTPAQDEGPIQRVGANVVAEGDLPAVARALAQLRAQQPPIHVVRLTLRTMGPVPPNSNPRLKVQLQVAAWKVHQP